MTGLLFQDAWFPDMKLKGKQKERTQIMSLIAFNGIHGSFYSSKSVWGCIIDEKAEE